MISNFKTCTGGVPLRVYVTLYFVMPSLRFKGNPLKNAHKNSTEFCYTFYDHWGWSTSRHSPVRLGRLSHTKGVCAMYSHEYLKHISTSSTSSLARSTFIPRVHFALRLTSFSNSSVHVLRTYIFVPPRFTTLHHALMHLLPDHHPLPNGRTHSLIIDWLYTTLHTIVTHTFYGFRQKLTQLVPIFVEFTPQYDPLPTYFRAWGYAPPSHNYSTHIFHHIHTNVHTNVHKSVFFHINSLVFYLLYITLFITL